MRAVRRSRRSIFLYRPEDRGPGPVVGLGHAPQDRTQDVRDRCNLGNEVRRNQVAFLVVVRAFGTVHRPPRLRDHIQRGSLDLGSIRAVVLDEADEMLDLGFREDLEFMLGEAPEDRRTLMFSATVPPQMRSWPSSSSAMPSA